MLNRIDLGMLALAVAGGVIGRLVWLEDVSPALLFVLMPLWGLSRNRRDAFALWFAYYLFGSSVIPATAGVFFGANVWWIAGFAMWLASAALLAVAWTLFTYSGWWRAAGLIPAWLMVSLPPLGVIGWLNPLISAGWLLPREGWAGIAAWFVAAMMTVAVFRWAASKATRTSLVMLTLLAVATTQFPNPQRFDEIYGWSAISTDMGKMPTDYNEFLDRNVEVIAKVKAELSKEETRVVILPEQVVGQWNGMSEPMWRALLPIDDMRERRQVVLIGAEVVDGKQRENALVAFTGNGIDLVHKAVQPVPVSMWTPWADDGVRANWLHINNGYMRNISYTVSMCYEDLLVWPILRSFAVPRQERPQAILSVANQWWVKGSGEDRIQRRSIEAWANMFGAELLRATNE